MALYSQGLAKQRKLRKIYSFTFQEYESLYSSMGFEKEGLLRQSIRQGNKYYDHWILSLLKEDWLSR